MRAWPLLLVLAGCAHQARPWSVVGTDDRLWGLAALGVVERAKVAAGDQHGRLAQGGVIEVRDDLEGLCPHRPGWRASGCAEAGKILVLRRPLLESAMAHEACELGLITQAWSWKGPGPVVLPDQAAADACARKVTGPWP